jgi:hypothetical protein
MRRTTMKKTIKQYTAYVPKTANATNKVVKNTVKRIHSFLSNIGKNIKRTGHYIDEKTAKRIRSMRKKRGGR